MASGTLVFLSSYSGAPVHAATVSSVDCPGNSNGDFNFAKASSDYVVSTPALSTSMSWSLTTPNKASSGGVPGVIEFCVYPNAVDGSSSGSTSTVTGESTSAVGANGAAWSAGLNCNNGAADTCVKSERPDGNPSNIPDNGGTTTNVLGITFSTAPTSYLVVLHINDPGECTSLFGVVESTCFITPATTPPPPKGTTSISTTVVDETYPAFFPPGFAGDSFHDTATVSIVTANDGFTPTGTVFYYFSTGGCDGTFLPFDSELVGTDSISTGALLAAGNYAFMAVYSGDSHYSGSTSACEPFSVVAFPVSPAVTKTATGTYTATFAWTVSKSASPTAAFTAGGAPATIGYAVNVTPDSGTISNIVVSGTITVTNTNAVPMSVTVTDTLSDSTTCSVTGGSATIDAGKSMDFPYTCSDGNSALPSSNSGSVSWSSGPASGSLSTGPVSISPFTQTIASGTVSVSDTLGGTLGTVDHTGTCDTSTASSAALASGTLACTSGIPATFTYSLTFTDPAGTCTQHTNTASVTTADTHSISSSNPVTVTDCQGADLTVSKTATPTFTRTFTWGITKSVDTPNVFTAGGASVTVHYTMSVTHDSGTDSAWAISGTITVTNPNDWESITLAGLTDSATGGVCTVAPGPYIVPASSSINVGYSCTFGSGTGGTNTATAMWSVSTYHTPSGSASGSATFAFTTPTTIVDGSVTVTDTQDGTLGTVSYTDPSPTTFTYMKTFTDPAGTCTSHPNTATFTTNTNGKTGSASQTVIDCQGANLTVGKTATPAVTFGVSKSASPASFTGPVGSSVTMSYTIKVTSSGWKVTGTITVSNPNDFESVTLTGVTDTIDNGGSCTVSGTTTQTIAASSSSTGLTYTCAYGTNPTSASFTNTATVTWDSSAAHTTAGSASGTASGSFGSVSVTDTNSQFGGPKTCDVTATCTFTYSITYTITPTCVTYANTATITAVGSGVTLNPSTAAASVSVCPLHVSGFLTMGFWKNPNGQGIITNHGGAGLQAFLTQFHPFSDAPATASAQATYVYNIINRATCTSTTSTCNPMLRAQMLATALDVYFSGSTSQSCATGSWSGYTGSYTNTGGFISGGTYTAGSGIPCGGDYIAAFNGGITTFLGSVKVYLGGVVCASDGGFCLPGSPFTSTSIAFNGQTCLTVMQMLAWQNVADPSADAGAVWYAQIKGFQVLAKDGFDAINNNLALTC